MRGFVLLVVTSGLLRLTRPDPHALVSTEGTAVDAFGSLVELVRRDASECAAYLKSTLDQLAAAYTAAQVPAVLHGVCQSGRFFHAFKSAEECALMTKKLLEAYGSAEPKFEGWCGDVQKLLEDEMQGCGCVGLPKNLTKVQNGTKFAVAKDGSHYPESYGGSCAKHDLALEQYCAGRDFLPSFCHEPWCYVSKDCKAADTKETFLFDDEMYYSYAACGGLDAFAAGACEPHKKAKNCTDFSDNCAWNEPTQLCQNKLCQCTGSSGGLNLTTLGLNKNYGQTCSAWDKERCVSEGNTEEPGMWCCKTWCFVEESCPSAQPSAVHSGLFFSYLACPDDVEGLSTCPWKEPVAANGAPLPLSSSAAAALEGAA